MPKKIVLASASPFRKMLFEKLRLVFETDAPDIDERCHAGEMPQQLVRRLSVSKAQAVAECYPDALIIGSDQVAADAGTILGKPGDHARAMAQLKGLVGRTVTFYTGLCLYNSFSGHTQVEVIPSTVVFRQLGEAQIERYLRMEQPYNCAGSFKSEGLGIALFERLQGDDPNALIGLPLIRLIYMLEKEGVQII